MGTLTALRVGESKEFTAHGRTFRVKKLNRNTWHLADLAITERSRFGTKTEIAQDIDSVMECGALPGGKHRGW